jgi:hypothetical protein
VRIRPPFAVAALSAFFPLLAVTAEAQPRPTAARTPPVGPPRFEVSFGAGIVSRSDLGDANADLRGRDGASYRLFATSSRFAVSVPIEARIGMSVTRRWAIEGRATFSRPELETSISGDVEGAAALTVAERLDRYVVDGAVVVALGDGRGATPFLAGGAGWVRQVHEGLTLIEDGAAVRGGGGVKYPLVVRNRGAIRGLGFRADGALVVLSKKAALGGIRRQIEASGAVYLMF